MYVIVIGVIIAIGAIYYGTRERNEQIIQDLNKLKKKMKEKEEDIYEDEDFVEILNMIDTKSSDGTEIKRRFNQITDPEKRKKVKNLLSEKFNKNHKKSK